MSPETAATAAFPRAAKLENALRKVIRGKDDVVRLAMVSLLARGHLLIEGVPGVGKTTLAHAMARGLDCSFQRIQFTSDMLPSDVLGISIYSANEQRFEFKRGPVFANVVLADEINRTTPKTQSALLEAMNEGQVTVDAHSYLLPQPFLVIATQNPVEDHGTYPLPESPARSFSDACAWGIRTAMRSVTSCVPRQAQPSLRAYSRCSALPISWKCKMPPPKFP
jgi:MoxR-like ATPase